MRDVSMPHPGHEDHLCLLLNLEADFEKYKELVKDAKFVCRGCGRAATDSKSLCTPEKL
jgi:hypothetical protein